MNSGQKHILLIDDNKAIRESLAWFVEQKGYSIVTANNGKEALEMLCDGLHPTLIFLDLMMPVIDGFLFRKLQKIIPIVSTIPTIIISASGCGDNLTLLPHEIFLSKPFDIKKLVEIIKKYCD